MSGQKRRPAISPEVYERLVEAASGPAALDCKPREARSRSAEELLEAALDAREAWRESANVWRSRAKSDG